MQPPVQFGRLNADRASCDKHHCDLFHIFAKDRQTKQLQFYNHKDGRVLYDYG